MSNPLLGITLVCLGVSALGYVFGVAIPEYWHRSDCPPHGAHHITTSQIVLHQSPDLAGNPASVAQPAAQATASRDLPKHESHGVKVIHEHWFKIYLETLSQFAETALTPEKAKTWWPTMGHIGTVPKEIATFAKLASAPGVKTICEIGFNAGHSSAVFLHSNPEAVMYQFDIMMLPYSERNMALFRKNYGDRFHFIKGSSTDGVPWFKKTQQKVCDIFSVDGMHEYPYCLTDMLNALSVMRVGSVMIADDISDMFPTCRDAWNKVVAEGYLKDHVCENQPEIQGKAWCYGTVVKTHGALHDQPLPIPVKVPDLKLDTM